MQLSILYIPVLYVAIHRYIPPVIRWPLWLHPQNDQYDILYMWPVQPAETGSLYVVIVIILGFTAVYKPVNCQYLSHQHAPISCTGMRICICKCPEPLQPHRKLPVSSIHVARVWVLSLPSWHSYHYWFSLLFVPIITARNCNCFTMFMQKTGHICFNALYPRYFSYHCNGAVNLFNIRVGVETTL